jgi:hypothetical protein
MLGFAPISALPISGLPVVVAPPEPPLALSGFWGGWWGYKTKQKREEKQQEVVEEVLARTAGPHRTKAAQPLSEILLAINALPDEAKKTKKRRPAVKKPAWNDDEDVEILLMTLH